MPLEKMLKSFSDKELKEYILNRIHTNDTNYSNDTKNLNDLRVQVILVVIYLIKAI